MIKLSFTQLALLAHAAQRADGNLMPLPGTITAPKPAINRSIDSLLQQKLIAETEVVDDVPDWRRDGDMRYSVHITDVGRQEAAAALKVPTRDHPAVTEVAKKQSKAALVVTLLQRDEGASLSDLTDATNWLPHTIRAALTGLRKKGHAIDKTKRDGVTCYLIPAVV